MLNARKHKEAEGTSKTEEPLQPFLFEDDMDEEKEVFEVSYKEEDLDRDKEQGGGSSLIQLTKEDVVEEVQYWSTAIFGYVLGANPPWSVINGFIRRTWKNLKIDKVSVLTNGVFLVRFHSNEDKEKALATGFLMFDSKPVILKEWTEDSVLAKQSCKKVPIWIKLQGLDVKFWGVSSLTKICGLIGNYLKCDEITVHRTFLSYTKILVEVEFNQGFPTELVFLDEKGAEQKVQVIYEWVPVECQKCKGIGHLKEVCRKGNVKAKSKPIMKPQENLKVWKPKVIENSPKVMVADQAGLITPIVIPQEIVSPQIVRGKTYGEQQKRFEPGGLTFLQALLSSSKGNRGSGE